MLEPWERRQKTGWITVVSKAFAVIVAVDSKAVLFSHLISVGKSHHWNLLVLLQDLYLNENPTGIAGVATKSVTIQGLSSHVEDTPKEVRAYLENKSGCGRPNSNVHECLQQKGESDDWISRLSSSGHPQIWLVLRSKTILVRLVIDRCSDGDRPAV